MTDNIIRIKRRAAGGAAGAPSSLMNAELAYNEVDDVLYYGRGAGAGGVAQTIEAIGGKGAIVQLTGDQTISGTKTFVNAISGSVTGNAGTATQLATARAINIGGDATGSANFNGASAITINVTLANSGVVAGSYAKVTVDAKGRVTGGAALAATDIPNLAASKITSGVFADGRIPNLDAGKITAGVLDLLRIPSLPASQVTTGVFAIAQIPDLSAAKITSGTLAVARIPSLDVGQITTGVFNVARIPDLDAGKITGVLDLTQLPSLPASKITSGTLDALRIPNLDAGKITTGVLGTARIPSLDASKVTTGVWPVGFISQGAVTQHQAALSIAASQVTGLDAAVDPVASTGSYAVRLSGWTGTNVGGTSKLEALPADMTSGVGVYGANIESISYTCATYSGGGADLDGYRHGIAFYADTASLPDTLPPWVFVQGVGWFRKSSYDTYQTNTRWFYRSILKWPSLAAADAAVPSSASAVVIAMSYLGATQSIDELRNPELDVPFNSKKLTFHGGPTLNHHAANKEYVDNATPDVQGGDGINAVTSGSTVTVSADATLARLVSPAFSGIATAPTQAAGNNSNRIATTAFVQSTVSSVIDAAPGTLDTLNELAAALGDDPNFATTVSTSIGERMRKDQNLGDLLNVVTARSNLGLGTMATQAANAVAITGGTLSNVTIDGGTF